MLNDNVGRKTVLAGIGLGFLSLFSLRKMGLFAKKKTVIGCSPADQKGTMKCLSQDGKLVEVDITHLKSLNKKVSDKELREWVKKS